MFRQIQTIVTSVFILLLSLRAFAVELSVEFSADAIQIAPGSPSLYSKMYVSRAAVRTETTRQGRYVIDIVYPHEGKRLILFPDKKLYLEQSDLGASTAWAGRSAKTPCEGMKKTSCRKLGSEVLRNTSVEKWQVDRKAEGKTLSSLHWIDIDRKLAIKEMLSDGSVSELIMFGKGQLDGRNVESWESRYYSPTGQFSKSKQWYDPELKIVIRDEQNNGYLRELKNIKVGSQDKKLFILPADYVKVSEKKK